MSNDIVAALKGLSLHGMASAWPEVLGKIGRASCRERVYVLV